MTQSAHNSPRAKPSRRDFFGHSVATVAVLAGPLAAVARLFRSQTGGEYELNETGQYILDRCDGRNTVETIARDLSLHYKVSYSRTLREVEEYVRLLKKENLIG